MGRSMRGITVTCALTLLACGGGGGGDEPAELVADPAVVTGCTPAPPAAGETRAKWVDCADELLPGLLTSGRVGDVVLENSRIKVVIRGFGSGYYLLGTHAGGIVDAARHGREDAVKEVQPVIELNGGGFEELVITEAGDDGPATFVARGPAIDIPFVAAAITTIPIDAIVEQRYILEPDADEVRVETVLYAGDGASGTATIGEAMFYGGAIASWLPGTGFVEGSANTQIVASSGDETSYGIVYPPTTATVQFVDIANVKLALGTVRTVTSTEPVERWLVVGDGSVASVTGRAWALRGVDTGTVRGTTAPGVDVHVVDDADQPITIARAGDDGSYTVDVPPGSYRLWTEDGPHRAAGDPATADVAAGGTVQLDLDAGATGTLSLSVADTGAVPLPARVVVRNSADRWIFYTGADGSLELSLAPDSYTLTVSRGMEYDAFTADPLVIAADATEPVSVTLERVVDTAGWISVDTHIHSEMSTDSQIRLPDRLHAVAAEGVEVAISTDHDFVTDYAPVIERLGLGDWVATRVGVEASSLVWGHVNSWPLEPDYDMPAGDAIPWYDRSPGEVFALMRDRGGGVVVQVNHPNSSGSGLFQAIELDPATLTARRDPADLGLDGKDLDDLSFDAVEVANDFNRDEFDATFSDWLTMVAAGHPATATGCSDSHGKSAYIGNSRTYVYVGDGNDDPATVDLEAVDAAIVARKAVVAQGAFVTAAIVDPSTGEPAAPGETVDLTGETDASVRITVQAPPWMPLDRIDLYAGTEIATTIDLDDAATAAVRYDDVVTVPIEGTGGFFVALVRPAGRGDPVLGQPDGSFTNPLVYTR